jgi:regulator of RNase E activity RraA
VEASVPALTDISDACDEAGVPAVRMGAITPVWPGCPQLTGPVATLVMRPATGAAGEDDRDPVRDIVEAMTALAGSIVLMDVEGRPETQCWGEFLTACAQRAGIPGAIINGAVRDVRGIEERKFPVFARGVHPARARGRLRLASVGAPVTIDGQQVHPGDLAAAADDGVILIPRENSELVLETARQCAARSARQIALLDAGAAPRDVFR